MAEGTAQLRARYTARFQTEVHSELLGRLCLGDVVVDREIITGAAAVPRPRARAAAPCTADA